MSIAKQFHTPTGTYIKELTQEELVSFASQGDYECKKELAKQNLATAKTDSDKLAIVLELLDLTEAK